MARNSGNRSNGHISASIDESLILNVLRNGPLPFQRIRRMVYVNGDGGTRPETTRQELEALIEKGDVLLDGDNYRISRRTSL